MSNLILTDADGMELSVPDFLGWTYTHVRNPVSCIDTGRLDGDYLLWEPTAADDESGLPVDDPARQQHKLRLPVEVVGADGPLRLDSCVLRHEIQGPRVVNVLKAIVHTDRVELVLPDGPPVTLAPQPGGEWRFDMDAVDALPESLGDAGDYTPGWTARRDGCTIGWENDYSTLDEGPGDPLTRGDVSDFFLNA